MKRWNEASLRKKLYEIGKNLGDKRISEVAKKGHLELIVEEICRSKNYPIITEKFFDGFRNPGDIVNVLDGLEKEIAKVIWRAAFKVGQDVDTIARTIGSYKTLQGIEQISGIINFATIYKEKDIIRISKLLGNAKTIEVIKKYQKTEGVKNVVEAIGEVIYYTLSSEILDGVVEFFNDYRDSSGVSDVARALCIVARFGNINAIKEIMETFKVYKEFKNVSKIAEIIIEKGNSALNVEEIINFMRLLKDREILDSIMACKNNEIGALIVDIMCEALYWTEDKEIVKESIEVAKAYTRIGLNEISENVKKALEGIEDKGELKRMIKMLKEEEVFEIVEMYKNNKEFLEEVIESIINFGYITQNSQAVREIVNLFKNYVNEKSRVEEVIISINNLAYLKQWQHY